MFLKACSKVEPLGWIAPLPLTAEPLLFFPFGLFSTLTVVSLKGGIHYSKSEELKSG
jgi:hypothetical protein